MQDNRTHDAGPPPVAGGPAAGSLVIRFGHFTLDLKSRELRKSGLRMRLSEKPFLVLATLVECPGEVVLREELRRRLWPGDTFVDFDNNLNTAVATLREMLGDSARAPRYIETLPRLGYRFIGTLGAPADSLAFGDPSALPAPALLAAESVGSPKLLSWRAWAAGFAAGAVAAVAIWLALAGKLPLKPQDSMSPPSLSAVRAAGDEASPAMADALYLLERGNPESLPRAAALLEQAAAEQPRHAEAHSALAEARLRMALRGLAPQREAFHSAERAARRALELDSALVAPHRTLAMVRLHGDWNLAAALEESAQALRADPADAQNHLVAAVVNAAAGQHQAAVAAARRAVALDPVSMRIRADLAFFLLAAGRLEEAAAESRAVLELQPDFAPALDFLLTASERLQRLDEAKKAAVRLMEHARAAAGQVRAVRDSAPREAVRRYRAWQVRYLEANAAKQAWPPMTMASIYASAGETDKAFVWLEQAYVQRDSMLVFLAANPDLTPVRGDSRFAALARRVGVPGPIPAS